MQLPLSTFIKIKTSNRLGYVGYAICMHTWFWKSKHWTFAIFGACLGLNQVDQFNWLNCYTIYGQEAFKLYQFMTLVCQHEVNSILIVIHGCKPTEDACFTFRAYVTLLLSPKNNLNIFQNFIPVIRSNPWIFPKFSPNPPVTHPVSVSVRIPRSVKGSSGKHMYIYRYLPMSLFLCLLLVTLDENIL